jgi:hypothetical protein
MEDEQEKASQKEIDTGARVLGSKNGADEREIQHIPESEPGTDKDQLAQELFMEFSQCVAPDRLN